MRSISFKFFLVPAPSGHDLFLRVRRRSSWMALALLLGLLGAGEVRAETYSIQLGFFKLLGNARLQYTSAYNALPEGQRGSLRIEKSGDLYAVRIGRFETLAQAEAQLPLIKSIAPEAFIRKGDAPPADVLSESPKPPAAPPVPAPKAKLPDPGISNTAEKPSWKVVKPVPPEGGGSLSGSAAPARAPAETGKTSATEIAPSGTTRVDTAIPANRAWVWGAIREISPLPPEQLGLKSGKEIFRFILQVEETRKIAGYPNLLAEKVGDLLTVFAESKPPAVKVGDKIKALVEYRGNRYSRFFWIIKTEAPAR